jgi:hypothetical protein
MTTRRERYIARITKLEASIEIWETTIDNIVEGENGEYWYTEPDGGQRATKLSPKELQEMIDRAYARIESLYNRLGGRGLVAVRVER